jgi:DNA-binding transcriptional LysR family regulator
VAEAQATLLPLKILPPPVELPPIEILMQWSSSRANDRATQWLRDLILQVAQEKEMTIHPAIKN